MATYIGKVQIGNDSANIVSIGDTLYGTCSTGAAISTKIVNLPAFDRAIHGIYIRVRFENGNTATSDVKLQIDNTTPLVEYHVLGDCTCSADDVVGFVWEEGITGSYWRVVSSSVTKSIKDYVSAATGNIISSAGGMTYRGTIGSVADAPTYTSLPTGLASDAMQNYSPGWVLKVITSGTYGDHVCEAGDLLIATDAPIPNQNEANSLHWTVAQANIDNAVYRGTNTFTNEHVVIADGTNGQVRDSGFTIGKSVPANAQFTDENTSYRYTLSNPQTVNAYTGNTTSDNSGTVLVSVNSGVLHLAKGIAFTTTPTMTSTTLNETTVQGPVVSGT